MANIWVKGGVPSSFAGCYWEMFKMLYSAGWSVMAWSDGTTAYNTGTVPGPYATGPGNADPVFPLTASGGSGAFPSGSASGAGGLNNQNAWMVMRQPKGSGSFGKYAGRRMFCWQCTSVNDSWAGCYSLSGSFVFSTAGDTHPSSNDLVTYLNGGTFETSQGQTRVCGMANDGMDGETEPFGFWFAGWQVGGGSDPAFGQAFDPLVATSVHPLDLEPFVHYSNGSTAAYSCTAGNGFFSDQGIWSPWTWVKYGYPSQIATRISAFWLYSGGNSVVPAGSDPQGASLGSNPYGQIDDLFPVIYGARMGRGVRSAGFKGVSTIFKTFSAVHARSGDVLTLNTARDKLILGDVAVDWDGSVPAL
jgi:hypothetical protein